MMIISKEMQRCLDNIAKEKREQWGRLLKASKAKEALEIGTKITHAR